MQILIPVIGFSASGGKRVLSSLASELTKMGHIVDFVVPVSKSKPYFPTLGNVITFDDKAQYPKSVRNCILMFKLWYYIFKNAKRYDFVLATHNTTAFPVWFGVINSKKRVYYIQAYEPDFCKNNLKGNVFRVLAKISYKLPFNRIVNAPIYRNYQEIRANAVLEPGIDLSVFNPSARTELSTDEKTVIVGCIGRKEKFKGTSLIIDAFVKAKAVVEKKHGLRLLLKVAFQLPEDRDQSLPEDAELVQPHGDQNLARFYANLDILVATGLIQHGAFHYPCMEGIACGPIVISNYSPGNSKNSFFLETVKEDVLVDAIVMCATNEKFRLSRQEREKIVEKFSWIQVGRKFESLLLSIKDG